MAVPPLLAGRAQVSVICGRLGPGLAVTCCGADGRVNDFAVTVALDAPAPTRFTAEIAYTCDSPSARPLSTNDSVEPLTVLRSVRSEADVPRRMRYCVIGVPPRLAGTCHDSAICPTPGPATAAGETGAVGRANVRADAAKPDPSPTMLLARTSYVYVVPSGRAR